MESYDRAISFDPGLMPAWFNKSSELVRDRTWEEALQAIGIALSLRQNNAVSWYVKGLLHANLKQGQKAKAALDKAKTTDAELLSCRLPVWRYPLFFPGLSSGLCR